MKNDEQNSNEIRICEICQRPLADDDHGNRKAHRSCAYVNKKQRQKEKYSVGNPAKLLIQKNEAVAAGLYKMDKQKQGILYTAVLEEGFKFNCPTTKRNHHNKIVYMMDQYGYAIEKIGSETLIFIYHESDLQ
jgi:hypothetical protein